jgi:hypothetical protein
MCQICWEGEEILASEERLLYGINSDIYTSNDNVQKRLWRLFLFYLTFLLFMSVMVTFWRNKKKQMNQSESTANRVSVLFYAVLHTNLELSSQFALSQLPRIASGTLVPFQSILQCNSGHENEYITTILVTSQNLV